MDDQNADSTVQRRPGEAVFAVLVLAASTFLLYEAYGISGFSALSGPGTFPMAAAAVMVVASAVSLLRTLRQPPSPDGLEGFRREVVPVTVVVFFALIVGFAVFLQSLGFLATAFLFLFLSIWFLHRRGPFRALAYALGSIVGVYVVFRLIFQVVLPEGVIPEREILAAISSLFSGGPAR